MVVWCDALIQIYEALFNRRNVVQVDRMMLLISCCFFSCSIITVSSHTTSTATTITTSCSSCEDVCVFMSSDVIRAMIESIPTLFTSVDENEHYVRT